MDAELKNLRTRTSISWDQRQWRRTLSTTMDRNPPEQPLRGGNSSADVVRVGETVRRSAMPWSASVDALLLHLESVGYEGSPRALGYDDRGRQVLSFVEGHTEPSPLDLGLARVREVGSIIRAFHDAVRTFVPPDDAIWNVLITPNATDIIAHHDLAPWNLVRTNTKLTFIDWDGAGPGSRLWDLAYAAHGFVPMGPDAQLGDETAGRRLAALADGYGLDVVERLELINMLAPRILSMHDFLRRAHETGAEPWSTLWSEGHGEVWQSNALYAETRRLVWENALL